VATIAICVVFVPIFLLKGTSKYLFSPLSMSVILSLCASFILSFTLVPVLFKLLLKKYLEKTRARAQRPRHPGPTEPQPFYCDPLWL